MTCKQLEACWPELIEKIRLEAAASERMRILQIEAMATRSDFPTIRAACLADPKCTTHDFRAKVFEAEHNARVDAEMIRAGGLGSIILLH